MKRNLYLPLFFLASILSLTSCGKKSDVAPNGSSAHGSVTVHGKTANFSVFTAAPSASATTYVANAYSPDSLYSVGFTLSPKPVGSQTYPTGSSGGYPIIVALTIADVDGHKSTIRYYGGSGESITYNAGTISTTGLSEYNLSTGAPIPGNGKLVFTMK